MKDGRLAPSGMEMVSAANHELRVPDVCQSAAFQTSNDVPLPSWPPSSPQIPGVRSPSVWQYPAVITPTALPATSQMQHTSQSSISQNSDSLSNGSTTPPTAEQPQISNNPNMDTKFVFPQTAIPISPNFFSSPAFFGACATSNGGPITPTLLTPAVGFTEPYFRAQGAHIYSPFGLAHPSALPGSLPKTPTLPPPSPHSIIGNNLPLTSQALPTSGSLVNSPFKGVDDMSKFSGMSPFILSPGLSPSRRTNGATFLFPTTTFTANGEAKVTSLSNGMSYLNGHDKSLGDARDHSPIIKVEGPEPPQCQIGSETAQ